MIEEKDAAKFLYRYNNTPLETIIDTDIKKMVEDRFNIETAKYTSTELGASKGMIMEAVKSYVVEYFKEYGITITVLGLKEGISFENPAIQKAIDEKFASEQELVIQQNKNEANIAKAEAEAEAKKIAAMAEAEALKILADAQAEANRVLAESLTEEILAQMYYEKWNGVLPYVYGSDGTIIQIPLKP
jgi:regulator of protease activity HflC (stomatin/prohibitin superfamily)